MKEFITEDNLGGACEISILDINNKEELIK